MPEQPALRVQARIQIGADTQPCELSLADGAVGIASAQRNWQWPGWQIIAVKRHEYTLEVALFDQTSLVLTGLGRRIDEVEVGLRRCRADRLVRLMAPAGVTPLEAQRCTDANGTPGYLYRYEDGLRWLPDSGPGFVRLYEELDDGAVDLQRYWLTLTGPFGQSTLAGLARRTRDLAAEVRQRVEQARTGLAQRLARWGWPWEDDLRHGEIRAHVPFPATKKRLDDIETAGLVAAERTDYWTVLRRDDLIRSLAISGDGAGEVRLVALGRLPDGDLYEVLSAVDHASYIFRDAEAVLRAWTEVGLRREPVFADAAQVPELPALLEVALHLRAAREGLLRRVVHDSPENWRWSLG